VVVFVLVVPPLVDQFVGFVRTLPGLLDDAGARFDEFVDTLSPEQQAAAQDVVARIASTVRENFFAYIQTVVNVALDTFLSVLNFVAFLVGFLVIPFWLWYVLADQPKGALAVNRLMPPWLRADFWAVLQIADRVFSSYIRGQLVLGVIIGVAVYLGFLLLQMLGVEGIRFTLILAVLAGLLEFIPYFGPILAAIPAVIVGLTHSWQTALIIALMYVAVQQLENNLLVPRITGNALEIHPAVLTVVMIALAPLGFIWLILAAPLAALIRDEFRYIYGRLDDPSRPAGVLPGEPLPPAGTDLAAPADTGGAAGGAGAATSADSAGLIGVTDRSAGVAGESRRV
jgi:predicted PurR-regulated permease PerM